MCVIKILTSINKIFVFGQCTNPRFQPNRIDLRYVNQSKSFHIRNKPIAYQFDAFSPDLNQTGGLKPLDILTYTNAIMSVCPLSQFRLT